MTGYEKTKVMTEKINATSLPDNIKEVLIKKYEIRFRFCKTKKSRYEMSLRINGMLELLLESGMFSFDECKDIYVGLNEEGE